MSSPLALIVSRQFKSHKERFHVYSLLLFLQASEVAATKASRGRSRGSLIIECEICAKRFRYQSDMKNHYESHFRTPARR